MSGGNPEIRYQVPPGRTWPCGDPTCEREDCQPPARPAAGDTRGDRGRLREALLIHHPIMRSETGPLSGCRCGQVGLGEDVIAHVVTELHAALNGTP